MLEKTLNRSEAEVYFSKYNSAYGVSSMLTGVFATIVQFKDGTKFCIHVENGHLVYTLREANSK